MSKPRRFHIVWWGLQVDQWFFGRWCWAGANAPYRWSLGLGPLEIRRWAR